MNERIDSINLPTSKYLNIHSMPIAQSHPPNKCEHIFNQSYESKTFNFSFLWKINIIRAYVLKIQAKKIMFFKDILLNQISSLDFKIKLHAVFINIYLSSISAIYAYCLIICILSMLLFFYLCFYSFIYASILLSMLLCFYLCFYSSIFTSMLLSMLYSSIYASMLLCFYASVLLFMVIFFYIYFYLCVCSTIYGYILL